MNSTQVIVKYPADIRNVSVDFTDVLVGGEQITSGSLSVSDPTGLTVSGLGFTASTISLNVGGGADKQSYGVQVTANTSGGHIYTKQLAVVNNSDLAANYQNVNVDAFQALVGKLEAGTSALGKVNFSFPATVDTTTGVVGWELLDIDGIVLSSGQAFGYQTVTTVGGKRVEAQAIISVPSNTKPTLEGQSYQIRWTLTLNGNQNYAYENLIVTGPNTVPEGPEDVIELSDAASFCASIVSPTPFDTVTADIYVKNDKLVADAPTTAVQTADGWLYTINVTNDGTLVASLDPYTVMWKQSNVARPNYVERSTGRLFVVNASLMQAVNDMRIIVNRAESSILGANDIIFTEQILLAYLRRGRDAFNSAYGMFTAFDMRNASGGIREYWLRFSEIMCLRAQFLAEGEKVFNLSGQGISLDVDRTSYYSQLADNMQSQLDNECKSMKQNLIKKGILGGDGNVDNLTAMRRGSNGAVAITITPASSLGWRWARRF
jgi:hypothetical protein